jgi:hypothetical protein
VKEESVAARIRRLVPLVGLLGTCLLGGEAAARLDDWLRLGVPLLASPDRESALVVAEPWGQRGRPDGQFRKWKLNAFGFRAPSLDLVPDPARSRILVLGASETFGLYEPAGKEYPAQLAGLVQERYEVVNVALAGMALPSMLAYWDHWASRFGAGKVLLYPSPLFYLDDKPPGPPGGETARVEASLAWRLRLTHRVQDAYHTLPAWVHGLRDRWAIWRASAGCGDGWEFGAVPQDRLTLFRRDLSLLVQHIRRCGVELILVTHASSAACPPRPEDEAYIRGMRRFFPRAREEVLVDFERQANAAIRDLAREEGLRVIDTDRALTGRREWFADLVHFNETGARQMAGLLADHLER